MYNNRACDYTEASYCKMVMSLTQRVIIIIMVWMGFGITSQSPLNTEFLFLFLFPLQGQCSITLQSVLDHCQVWPELDILFNGINPRNLRDDLWVLNGMEFTKYFWTKPYLCFSPLDETSKYFRVIMVGKQQQDLIVMRIWWAHPKKYDPCSDLSEKKKTHKESRSFLDPMDSISTVTWQCSA